MGCIASAMKVGPMTDINERMLEFTEKGGHQGAAKQLAAYYKRGGSLKINRIEKAQERSMTLAELSHLRVIIADGCNDENWTCAFSGKSLTPDEVHLYHLNYNHISPATVPEGVVLTGLQGRVLSGLQGSGFKKGDFVEQHDSATSGHRIAAGYVSKWKGGQLTVTVTQGKFLPSTATDGITRHVTVGGEDVGEPATVLISNSVSYKELINRTPAPPTWFASHWWGEPVLHFILCCETHAKLRKLGDKDACYWVCAYANRQHDLGTDISEDPDKTSFRKAMLLSQGVLLILDKWAMPFERIWCCFELHRTIVEDNKLMDIITIGKNGPVMLSEGTLPDEEPYVKRRREMDFPITLLTKGLRARMEEGQASVAIDRIRILNCIAKRKDSLDDHSVLERVKSRRALDMFEFDAANKVLAARFAQAAWPQAVKCGTVENFDKSQPNTLSLPKILKEHRLCKEVRLDFRNFEEFNDANLKSVAKGLPDHIKVLELFCGSCTALTDSSVSWMLQRLPGEILRLSLSLAGCEKLSDDSAGQWVKHMPKKLMNLWLCYDKTKVGDGTLSSIARALPQDIKEINLGFRSCQLMTDAGMRSLGSALPRKLESLELDFYGCSSLSEKGVRGFLQQLPASLKSVHLQFRGTGAGRDFVSMAEAKEWLA